ncbi:hypothetical protein [Subtercola sp. PAMC28395]|uniref:hypothetical protein n=1 Tax=Subtercola sp. PAMC28395 TaxID=2846775 RepID=UPI00352CF970
MQTERPVVSPGLPLDSADAGVCQVVRDGFGNEVVNGGLVGVAEGLVGDESAAVRDVTSRSGPSRLTFVALGVSASVRSSSS